MAWAVECQAGKSVTVEDEYAIQYREKHREQCRKYNEKHHLKQPTPKETPKLTEEERKERNRIRSREYYLANREKYKSAKKKWYQEHREYALQYQKAYDNGYRIGTKGPCKKSKKRDHTVGFYTYDVVCSLFVTAWGRQ